jgi:hypothetical protein
MEYFVSLGTGGDKENGDYKHATATATAPQTNAWL